MKVTMEADYAVRIIYYLSEADKKTDARTISAATGITLRFSLKILRKLVKSGVVTSFVGVGGGYCLAKPPAQISLLEVIEAVDGSVTINRCLDEESGCSREGGKGCCPMHSAFSRVNQVLRTKLSSITFDSFLDLKEEQ